MQNALTSLKVQQEPAVAEVEVCVITVLLHQLKQLRVQNLRGVTEPSHTHTHTQSLKHQQNGFNKKYTWMSERMLAKCVSMAPP